MRQPLASPAGEPGPVVRIGIIGCGGAALPVCAAVLQAPAAALTMACDLDETLARDVGERYGVPYTTEAERLLGRSDVDAVYIAVPHDRLASLALAAVQAGKAVLVEKPMALRLEDLDHLEAAATQRRVAAGVLYELRHAPVMRQARQLVRAGALGEIEAVRVQTLIDKPAVYWQSGLSGRSQNSWRAQKQRAGGGVLLMNTSHQLDLVHHLTGLEVCEVTAQAATRATAAEVEDVAAGTLRYSNGALGSLLAGSCLAGSGALWDWGALYGSNGQLVIPDPWERQPLRVFLRQPAAGLAADEWHTWPAGDRVGYEDAVQAFCEAVLSGQPAPTGVADARRVLTLVLGLYESAANGRAVRLGWSLQEGQPHAND